jgi:mannose-6-phosphate isomerase-like protein (cupin superfamily)
MRVTDGVLEQSVIDLAPGGSTTRATDQAEEVLFVVSGQGELRLHDRRYALGPETGVNLAPGQDYELHNEGSDPMRTVSVRIAAPAPSAAPAAPADGASTPPADAAQAPSANAAQAPSANAAPPERITVRRLADQEEQNATTERSFRIVADPTTGLHSATHFVGYVPTARAPDHFHTYDEVIYVLNGQGAFHAGGKSRAIGAGSCIELPARTVHCLENTGQDVMRLVAVFVPAGSPAAAYYPDGTPAFPGTPALTT